MSIPHYLFQLSITKPKPYSLTPIPWLATTYGQWHPWSFSLMPHPFSNATALAYALVILLGTGRKFLAGLPDSSISPFSSTFQLLIRIIFLNTILVTLFFCLKQWSLLIFVLSFFAPDPLKTAHPYTRDMHTGHKSTFYIYAQGLCSLWGLSHGFPGIRGTTWPSKPLPSLSSLTSRPGHSRPPSVLTEPSMLSHCYLSYLVNYLARPNYNIPSHWCLPFPSRRNHGLPFIT